MWTQHRANCAWAPCPLRWAEVEASEQARYTASASSQHVCADSRHGHREHVQEKACDRARTRLGVGATGLVFFGIGAAKSRWSLAGWAKSGVETLLIGMSAAGLSFCIGYELRAIVHVPM